MMLLCNKYNDSCLAGIIRPVLFLMLLLSGFVVARGVDTLSAGTGQENSFEDAYQKVLPSTVRIDFYPPSEGKKEVGAGMVFALTGRRSALILTAHHVVNGEKRVKVYFNGLIDEPFMGIVSHERINLVQDVAVILVKNAPEEVRPVRFHPDLPGRGSVLGIIGHPRNVPFKLHRGALDYVDERFLYHSANLSAGNSGGPVFDECGRVVGINVRKQSLPQLEDPNLSDEDREALRQLQAVQRQKRLGFATPATLLQPTLMGWYGDIKFDKKWDVQKRCSYKPMILGGGAGAGLLGGILYWLLKPDSPQPDPEFGFPPDPGK